MILEVDSVGGCMHALVSVVQLLQTDTPAAAASEWSTFMRGRFQ